MAEATIQPNAASAEAFLASVEPPAKREDARARRAVPARDGRAAGDLGRGDGRLRPYETIYARRALMRIYPPP